MTADQLTERFDATRREFRSAYDGVSDPDVLARLDDVDAALAGAGAVLSGLLAEAEAASPSQH